MLFVCTDVSKFQRFKEKFKTQNMNVQFHDLSKLPSENLAQDCMGILNHYDTSAVFLGYIEAGWMLNPTNNIFLRYLIRKFPVGIVCNYTDSIPYAWKNGIDTLYV